MSAKRNSTRQSRLVNRHKVPCGCLRGGGWLILVRDLEKASQRREYLSGAFGSWYFSTQNVLLPLTLPYPTAKEQGRSEGGNQAARPAWQCTKLRKCRGFSVPFRLRHHALDPLYYMLAKYQVLQVFLCSDGFSFPLHFMTISLKILPLFEAHF